MSAIGMLWLRQLKRYARSKTRVVGGIGQPLLFLLALGFGFGPIYAKAGGGSYIQFIAPGIIAMGILFTAVFAGIEVVWDKQFGFLKEMLVAPVSRAEIMFGRTLGGATVAVIQGVIVFLFTLIAGFRPSLASLPLAFLFMALTAILFTALSTAIASVMDDMQGFPLVMNFIVMPIFFLSGALFPLQEAPTAMTTIASFDPLAYGVDGIRWALTGAAHFGFLPSLLVLAGFTAAFLGLGTWLFSKIQI